MVIYNTGIVTVNSTAKNQETLSLDPKKVLVRKAGLDQNLEVTK